MLTELFAGMFYTRSTTLTVPVQALDTALEICQQYCRKKDHDDIDVMADVSALLFIIIVLSLLHVQFTLIINIAYAK